MNQYTVTVNYLIENTTTQLKSSYSTTVSHGAAYDVTAQVPATLTYGEKNDNYVKVSSDAETGNAFGNVIINVYYALDNWKDADQTEDEDDKDSLTGGDGIPDKYQAVVTYKVVGGTWKDKTTDDQIQVFTLKTKNADGAWVEATPAPVLGDTIPTGMISSYSRTASQSWDKGITKDTKVTESVTYTYTFTKKSSGGGGGGSHKPTVTIPDDVPTGLNGDDHYAYIVGYPDSTVRPQNGITRAEVATIFFRLLTDETRTVNATKTNNYADVSSDKWYNQAVSTLSAMGIIKGDSRGNFNPNAPITRAEFAAIAARFDKTEDVAVASFGDVATHWAKPEISVAANNGWINGYTDGTFHPDSRITRAEAMAMINRVLQRLPESKADLLDGMIQWSDNADTSKWYYLAVQEATNSHYYELKANQHEKWTKLRENRDWTELEK